MTTLIARLKEHDAAGQAYWLDYVTLLSGFTYRNLDVSRYDEEGILTTYERPQDGRKIEVYLKATEVASAQIITTK